MYQNQRHIKKRYTRKPLFKRRTGSGESGKKFIFRLLGYCVGGLAILGLIASVIIYEKYIADLPDIKSLETLDIAEASTIYDKDGNELYKVYKEKRTYIPYEDISEDMVHAIVAGEDQSFFTNPGIDFYRMTGAVVYYILGKTDRVKGTSTISQQLIRNTIISNETSLERKIKEMYLSYKMTKELSKEKILELYLNKIFFGNNAYGIEQASKTFFGTGAKNLGVLESSILASLPKGPSFYSPYNHGDRLLGYPYTYHLSNPDEELKILSESDITEHKTEVDTIKETINDFKFEKIGDSSIRICGLQKDHFKTSVSIDGNGCTITEYANLINLLNNIQIKGESDLVTEYEVGRKDFILGRMFEDGYIDADIYKDSIVRAIGYKFNVYTENFKYPYFVMYVKEYVESKYGSDMLENAGLKIYTTIDPKLQDKAEELISKYGEKNANNYDANNSALVSIDNKTGDIISMVGGRDYTDMENKGNINMVTSPVQPGSSFKPFVYALAIDKKEIGTKTPIYDVKTEFPGYGSTPKNFDGQFMGKMNISTALNHSRNIPALKMFYMAGGEKSIVDFLETLGITGLRHDNMYGVPMALGTAEISPLELAGAYSVFANLGLKKEISPIKKIVDSKGLVIEERGEIDYEGMQVFDPESAYIIDSILSDTSSRPAGWNSFISLPGRPVAAKTGTSTKNIIKNGVKTIYPRNLLTIGYTPQITTVVWAGNADGKEVNMKGDGLNAAGPIWRDFMKFAHEGKPVEKWEKPKGVKEIQISNISGYLPGQDADKNFLISSLFKNSPTKTDNSMQNVEVDALCGGKVTPETPIAAISSVFLVNFHSIDPTNATWEKGVKDWVLAGGADEIIGGRNFVLNVSEEICEREGFSEGDIEFKVNIENGTKFVNGGNYIELAYRSKKPIERIDVLIGETKFDSIKLDGKKEGGYRGSFAVPLEYSGKNTITFRAVDSMYFFKDDTYDVNIEKSDGTPPKITLDDPGGIITIYQTETYTIKGSVYDATPIKSINFYLDGVPLKIGETNRDFSFLINEKNDISLGEHTIKIEAVDNTFQIAYETISLIITEETPKENPETNVTE